VESIAMIGPPEEPDGAAGDAMSTTERQRVAKLVDERLNERWKSLVGQVKLTAWVLGGLAALLGFSELVTRRGVTQAFHTYVLGFDQSFSQRLERAYHGSVVLSYSNSFSLDPVSERFVKVLFYAGPGQEVDALVNLIHSGNGPAAKVQIRIGGFDRPVWEGTRDLGRSFNLLPFLDSSTAPPVDLPKQVHELTFSVEGITTDDKVYGSVLVNVKGREDKQDVDTAKD